MKFTRQIASTEKLLICRLFFTGIWVFRSLHPFALHCFKILNSFFFLVISSFKIPAFTIPRHSFWGHKLSSNKINTVLWSVYLCVCWEKKERYKKISVLRNQCVNGDKRMEKGSFFNAEFMTVACICSGNIVRYNR